MVVGHEQGLHARVHVHPDVWFEILCQPVQDLDLRLAAWFFKKLAFLARHCWNRFAEDMSRDLANDCCRQMASGLKTWRDLKEWSTFESCNVGGVMVKIYLEQAICTGSLRKLESSQKCWCDSRHAAREDAPRLQLST